MKVKVKICGISRFDDTEYVNEAMPDYIGFVFAESKRKIDYNKAFLLRSEIHPHIKSVGVFVNEDISFIKKCCDGKIIDFVQLHGDEDEKYIRKLKKEIYKPIIKAVRVSEDMTIPKGLVLEKKNKNEPDYTLFDTYRKNSYGGTGQAFDWEKIKTYNYPFFLAGGLGADNIKKAVFTCRPYCVDVSSKVETDGKKDRDKILEFVNLVRSMEL